MKRGIVGVYDGEDPPVPIPNTVVKLAGAENTWLATTREDKSMPTLLFFLCLKDKARWSSGQDGGLSRRNQEFDSPTGHQNLCRFWCVFIYTSNLIFYGSLAQVTTN